MSKFISKISLFTLLFIIVYQFNIPISSPLRIRSFIFSTGMVIKQSTPFAADKHLKPNYKHNIFNEVIKYSKNNIGFNAEHNFYIDSIQQEDYAVIGDSFVESSVCGLENSISFLLEQKTGQKVYNFGINGGNINNYNEIYEKYKLNRLNKVFIMLTGQADLMYSQKKGSSESEKVSSIRFFNKMYSLINSSNNIATKVDYSLVKKYPNVIYILHDGLTKKEITHLNDNSLIEIDLNQEFRFSDGHYKKNGNLKIVNEMIKY